MAFPLQEEVRLLVAYLQEVVRLLVAYLQEVGLGEVPPAVPSKDPAGVALQQRRAAWERKHSSRCQATLWNAHGPQPPFYVENQWP